MSNFTEFDAKKLFKLYRHAMKKDSASQDGKESSQEKGEKKQKPKDMDNERHKEKKHNHKEKDRHNKEAKKHIHTEEERH